MKKKLEEWLRRQEFTGYNIELEHLRTGESNAVFKVRTGGGNLVIKTRDNDKTENRLEREAETLRFLKDRPVPAPEPVHFEEVPGIGPVLVQREVGQKDVEFGDLSHSQIQELAETLCSLHSIDVDSYLKFAGEETRVEKNAEEYFEKKITEAREFWNDYTDLRDEPDRQIKSLYEESLEALEQAKSDRELDIRFCHMDFIANMRSAEDGIVLVDWELARPELPECSLLTQFRRGRLEEIERKKLLEAYRDKATWNLVLDELERPIWISILVQDVLWAAERLEREKKETSENSNPERYIRKLRDRRKRLEIFLEENRIEMRKM